MSQESKIPEQDVYEFLKQPTILQKILLSCYHDLFGVEVISGKHKTVHTKNIQINNITITREDIGSSFVNNLKVDLEFPVEHYVCQQSEFCHCGIQHNLSDRKHLDTHQKQNCGCCRWKQYDKTQIYRTLHLKYVLGTESCSIDNDTLKTLTSGLLGVNTYQKSFLVHNWDFTEDANREYLKTQQIISIKLGEKFDKWRKNKDSRFYLEF